MPDSLAFLANAAEAPSLWGPALRLLLGTAVLVVLALSAHWWLPRILPGKLAGLRGGPIARVVGRQFIGPKKALVLVEIDGRRLLFAETPERLDLVTELGGVGVDQLADQLEASGPDRVRILLIVFGFLRQAIGTQQMPPNQVLVGLALFLTLFIMRPVLSEIHDEAFRPYLDGTITQAEGLARAQVPLRDFMLRQTREKDLGLFVRIAGNARPDSVDDLSFATIVPAFVISELRIAFQIGFLLYLPFLIIDMVVASVLMSTLMAGT